MRNLIIALLMALPLSATAQGIIRHDTPKPQRQQTTKKPAAKQAAKPAPKAADPIKKLYSDMVYVEGGTFTMGAKADENYWDVEHAWPAHQVTVSGFYLCRYETTQALWQKVMGKNPSECRGANHPVESVSWNDIQNFIRKAQRAYRQALPSAHRGRMGVGRPRGQAQPGLPIQRQQQHRRGGMVQEKHP